MALVLNLILPNFEEGDSKEDKGSPKIESYESSATTSTTTASA
jgi:hypothetical protein